MIPDMKRERGKVYIYGKHALMEALLHTPRVIKKVFLSAEMNDAELRQFLARRNVPFSFLKNREATHMVGADTAHQGVIAIVDTSLLLVDFADFVSSLASVEDAMLVLLDELTDPHNVGAIIRSAAAFGASGVLLPRHNQAPVTGAVVKASAGMAFRVPLVAIGNVNYAIDALKKKGFCAYGLAMGGAGNVAKEQFDAPTLFVVGNEGEGIREKTLERCDVVLRIPMHPRCESLNASVSAAVAFYAWSAAHPKALRGQHP